MWTDFVENQVGIDRKYSRSIKMIINLRMYFVRLATLFKFNPVFPMINYLFVKFKPFQTHKNHDHFINIS